MLTPTLEQIGQAALEWDTARVAAAEAKALRNQEHCEDYYRGTGEPDDPSTPRCDWKNDPKEMWCDRCKAAQPLHVEYRKCVASRQGLRRKLQRLCAKARTA